MKKLFFALLVLTLSAGCAPKEQKVMARFVPERYDDFVFENNLIAGRICAESRGAFLHSLRRTKVGEFSIENSLSVDEALNVLGQKNQA